MKHIDAITEEIRSAWGETPGAEYCLNFVHSIEHRPFSDLQHISYQDISEAAKCADMDTILSIANYLSGAIGILEINFEITIGQETIPIEKSDAYIALTKNVIADPNTGKMIENASSHIILYYSAGHALMDKEKK